MSANLTIFGQVQTNAAHIIEVSLEMAYYVRPKHVELTNKQTIQCKKLLLIFCESDMNVFVSHCVSLLYRLSEVLWGKSQC
jgi:hypothetical protein